MHNNMITINGRKMGKSYNNVIKLTELFSGSHPILEKAYSPMTVRFFILQTQYRSTLDFSNEALQAAERGWKRLWEAYAWLQQYNTSGGAEAKDKELEQKVIQLVSELDEYINDDLNTAKVLANLFELVPVINGIKDKHIAADALSDATLVLLKTQTKLYIEDILGLKAETAADHKQLDAVMQLLMELRKDARKNKDFATSDRIRNKLAEMGIQLKDEKDGGMSYTMGE
jgi:cysteinyl-tRNA synthetase